MPAIVGTPIGAAALWLWAASTVGAGENSDRVRGTSTCVAPSRRDVVLGPERQ